MQYVVPVDCTCDYIFLSFEVGWVVYKQFHQVNMCYEMFIKTCDQKHIGRYLVSQDITS